MAAKKPSDHDEPGDEVDGVREPEDIALPVFDPDEIEAFEDEDDEDEDDAAIDEDALSELIEEEPRTVLITGACGNIGRKLRDAWVDVYDLVLIDKSRSEDDLDVIVADLETLDNDWITHFHGVDTVVHLAANGDEFAPWETLIGPNLDALANVFHAAALAGVERIIFASSNHVMGDYERIDDGPITVDMKPMPDGPYAVTKLVGERLGQSLARAFDLTFIALRLGWIQDGKESAGDAPPRLGAQDVAFERRPDPPVRLRRRGRDRRPFVRRGQWRVSQPRNALGPLRRRRAARLPPHGQRLR